MSRRIKLDQIDPEEQLLVRLAWACEIEGMTQAEAADRFGITRLRVNKALSEARQRGVIRVSIDSVYASAAELEWRLVERFDLSGAVVAPRPASPASVTPLVAAALGGHLSRVLQDPKLTRFGMSWGNTLNLATRYMQSINRPDLEIVSVMGGVTRGSDVNSYEITTRLADLCNAEHSFFTAPIFADSREMREMLMGQEALVDVLGKIRSCQAVALATSDLDQSWLVSDAMPKGVDVAELLAMGAVGDLIGYVLDAQGEVIDHEINDRVIGVSLDDLAAIPNVILAAGGAHKTRIMRAALRRGLVNTLVTDEDTAAALLGQG